MEALGQLLRRTNHLGIILKQGVGQLGRLATSEVNEFGSDCLRIVKAALNVASQERLDRGIYLKFELGKNEVVLLLGRDDVNNCTVNCVDGQ